MAEAGRDALCGGQTLFYLPRLQLHLRRSAGRQGHFLKPVARPPKAPMLSGVGSTVSSVARSAANSRMLALWKRS